MNYCVAVALAYGTPQLDHFTDEAVRDPTVVGLLDKVTVDGDEAPDGDAARPSTVRIRLLDGRELSSRVKYPKGHRKNPISPGDLDEKVISCSRDLLSRERAAEVIDAFRTLDTAADVRVPFRLLRCGNS